MTGRRLCCEEEAIHRGFGGTDCARRRPVWRETIEALEQSDPPGRYHRLAKQNLDRWRSATPNAGGLPAGKGHPDLGSDSGAFRRL